MLVEDFDAVFVCHAPPSNGRGVSAGRDLGQALRVVLRCLVREPAAKLVYRPEPGAREWVQLYAVRGTRVHVVGRDGVADRVRDLFATAGGGEVSGWRLHEVSRPGTLLHRARPFLDSRSYRLLSREGFATVEEVVAVPDAGLLSIRGVGRSTVDTIRQMQRRLLGGEPGRSGQGPLPAEAVGRVESLRDRLPGVVWCRHGAFLQDLVMAEVPQTALDVIAGSLADEAVPQLDPTVVMLLDTAGLLGLLKTYRATHADPSQVPPE
ncbi:MAG: hypothetical protein HOQ24_10965 [Mycobacteriaceae bacterium]|nr:hypothetical protein [Mycobacteriaceae bacterium]